MDCHELAVIEDGVCTNVVVFPTLMMTQEFLVSGMLQGDAVVELDEGFGIGDQYKNGTWVKQEK